MDEYKNEIELIDLLNVLWKRKWLIIFPTLLCVVAAGVIGFLSPPVWEVNAIIQPSKFFTKTEQGQFEEVIVVNPRQIAGQINEASYNNLIAAEMNLNIRNFPNLRAENMRDTDLVRVSLKAQDVEKAKSILVSLFSHLKRDLDKKIDVEIKALDTQIDSKKNAIKEKEIDIKEYENRIQLKKLQIEDKKNDITIQGNEIIKQQNNIQIKDLEIQSEEIEKERIKKEIETYKNKLKISAERVQSILEEMKAVKQRIDEIEDLLKKTLAEKKQGSDSISLLLYSNEIQQNLRYYNTLDEKLSIERITQENINLDISDKEEQLRQIDNQIRQIEAQKDSIKADIDNLKMKIAAIENEIDKINNEIESVKNEIDKIENAINTHESEILLLEERKLRIDYAQLIKEPTSSLFPVAPRKVRYILIAGILSLMIFTVFAFFLEYVQKHKK